jgi:hypothetical protein
MCNISSLLYVSCSQKVLIVQLFELGRESIGSELAKAAKLSVVVTAACTIVYTIEQHIEHELVGAVGM